MSTGSKSVRRGSLTVLVSTVCLALAIISTNAAAHADETTESLPSLRGNREALQGVIKSIRFLGEPGIQGYDLPVTRRFDILMPGVTGVGTLSQPGIHLPVEDQVSLGKFVMKAIEVRIEELELSDDIELRYPGTDPMIVNDKWSCHEILMEFYVHAREVALAEGKAMAVVISLNVTQADEIRQPDNSLECIDGRYPARVALDGIRILVIQDPDRERILGQLREALLSLIDNAVVLRLVASHDDKQQLIRSWLGSGN
jgi:hypothetical protein